MQSRRLRDREHTTFWPSISPRTPDSPAQPSTIPADTLNHVIVFGERHARRVLKGYLEYYHGSRTHLGLEKDAPNGRAVELPEFGPVRREAMVGGLHSRYYRDAV